MRRVKLDAVLMAGAASALVLAAPAFAADAASPAELSELVVVAPTPLAGDEVDADKLPGMAASLGGEAFARSGSPAVTQALQQRVAGISLSDTQGNDFTRDVNFRGFQASPLQGTPQGLAVYMNGVRLNEAFGDTVNWDLVPEIAISRADLFTSNPAFGLNALGGAVTLRMKDGFGRAGGQASVEGGRFGKVYGAAEQSFSNGPFALYVAADGGQEDGWRLHSPSKVARGFADLGWKGGDAEIHLNLAGAANDFGVVGPTPVDLLAADRRAVFTFPQKSRNNMGLAALNGSLKLSGGWSAQGVVYVRKFNQHHIDGNDGDFEGCTRSPTDPLFNTLCVEDGDFPDAIRPPAAAFQVLTSDGTPVGCPPQLPGENRPCNGVAYGSLDRTRTDATSWGGSAQVTRSGPLGGHGNAFAAGVSLDRSRARFSANSTLGIIQPDLLVDVTPGIPGVGQPIRTAGAIAYSPVEVRTKTTYTGVYATDTFDVTGALSVTLSARYNHARVTIADLTGFSPDLNGKHSFNRLNPAAGFAWRVADGLSVYGGYSEANRAPTALELGCSDPLKPCLLENALVADPPLKQVIAKTWEAGLRGQPHVADGILKWRAGVFTTDNHHDIVALASAIQGRGSFANVPRTRRRGFELSAEYASETWLAYASWSHLKATYRFDGDLPSPNSPFADDDGDVQVSPGDRIGGVPGDRFKAGADFAATPQITIGGDVVGISSQYLVGDEGNQADKLRGYWTANLHASWQVAKAVQVYGRVDNLFNSHRATYGTYFETESTENVHPSPLPDDADPRTVTPLYPRTFLVGVRLSW